MPASLLLTAFEPVGGRTVNASLRVLAPLLAEPPAGVAARVLPVDFRALKRQVPALLGRLQPQRWLLLGETVDEDGDSLRCERVAKNFVEPDWPDNQGSVLGTGRAVRGGPDAYLTTLDPERLREHFLARSIPAELSESAGAHACNLAFYLALHHGRRAGRGVQVGFVHIPRHYRRSGRTLGDIREALMELAVDLAERPSARLLG